MPFALNGMRPSMRSVDDERLQDVVSRLREQRTDSSSVEAKRATDALPGSLRPTLSAFSNTAGGIVVLGLAEELGFQATGVADGAKMLADFGAMCAGELEPPIRPRSLEIVRFEGVDLVVAEISALPIDDKPCFVLKQGKERGSYIRTSDGDRRMTTHEIATLTGNRTQPRDDELVVQGATLADLSQTAVSQFLARLRSRNARAFPLELEDERLLTSVGAVAKVDGEVVPTRAGLLALGVRPQQFYPQLNVTFVHHPTIEGRQLPSGERFIDNQRIDGSIPEMTRTTLDVLRRNMARRAIIAGLGRRDVYDYPELTLREAIVNALIHRDLKESALGTQVQVDMYPDRVVITNPGGLFGPATIEDLESGETPSSSRNARLVSLLEDIVVPGEDQAVCENRGSGIRTMQQSLADAGMSPARLEDRFTSFRVTFPNNALLDSETVDWISRLGQVGLTDSQHTALALMRHGESLTNSIYRTRCNLDSSVARSELQDLVGRGLVEQSGATSATRYGIAVAVSEVAPGRVPPADRREQILRFIGRNHVTRAEVQEATGLGPQAARSWLKTLQDEDRIRLDGKPTSNKVRYYAVPPFIDDEPEGPTQMQLTLGPD